MNNLNNIYMGTDDGLGMKINQLIKLNKHCEQNNITFIYVWKNCSYRRYTNHITFNKIKIINIDEFNKFYKKIPLKTINFNNIQKNIYNINNHKFNFKLPEINTYDTAIHIRGTDRLISNTNDLSNLKNQTKYYSNKKNMSHIFSKFKNYKPHNPTQNYAGINDVKKDQSKHFSTPEELNDCIEKTINYVNNNDNIKNCIIVSDDNKYINKIKERITKNIVSLNNNQSNINRDWVDFYYLTKATDNIIMCSKYSTFSYSASILSNLNLITFFDPEDNNLPSHPKQITIK
tara:strand:+ start:7702 stop:8568 length:867 start_codon:yes stop_codon:yes gene_type:complete